MSAQQPPMPNIGFPNPTHTQQHASGPAAAEASLAPPVPAPPAAGNRLALSTDNPFPSLSSLPPSSLHDLGGPHQPVYVGSAIFENSVHPCKIVPHLNLPVRVPYGGGEHEHRGRFDLLQIDDRTMEWVITGHGKIPQGRRPVEGGYEENGARLFHALAQIDDVWVPGKTGEHLGAGNFPFNGEQVVPENYHILFMLAVLSRTPGEISIID